MSVNLVSTVVEKALDGLFVRQAATANNLANASSEGFVPTRISFEGALREAAAWRPGDSIDAVAQRIARVSVRVDVPLPDSLGGVKLDSEISLASETSVRYAMLTGMLDRTLQLRQLAIKGA